MAKTFHSRTFWNVTRTEEIKLRRYLIFSKEYSRYPFCGFYSINKGKGWERYTFTISQAAFNIQTNVRTSISAIHISFFTNMFYWNE